MRFATPWVFVQKADVSSSKYLLETAGPQLVLWVNLRKRKTVDNDGFFVGNEYDLTHGQLGF